MPQAKGGWARLHDIEESKRDAQPRDSTPSRGSRVSRPSTPDAPAKDFAKVANSIVRDVVPTGQFTGKSKQLYDYLYAQTRGAIQPTRTVCLTKIKLMVGAGIGSEVTLRANLIKLKSMGLITEDVIPGTHGGNEYTVRLPEEATPSRGSRDSRPQFLESLDPLEATPSRASLIVDSTTAYSSPKTSFKTTTIDDEQLPALLKLERKLAGKNAPVGAWAELDKLLADELNVAAARTGTISNVPAFLTEHLRRRLAKPELKKEVKAKAEPAPEMPVTPPDAAAEAEYEAARKLLEGKKEES